MRKIWLLCVLLEAVAWGQTAPGAAAAPAQAPAQAAPATPPSAQPAPRSLKPAAPAAPANAPAVIPDNAPVLTIKGVCAPQPKNGAKAAAAKSPAAAKTAPADCKTVITKAEFDTLLKAIPNANANPQVKRTIAARLPGLIAWSNEAKKKGLDKTPEFAEMVKFARVQILAGEMQQKVQEDAGKVSDKDIADYYNQHLQTYEQFNLERLFVPRTKTQETSAPAQKALAVKTSTEEEEEEEEEKKGKDEKTSAEQQKTKEAEEKAKQQENEQAMTKLADSLHDRAAAGEDFAKLQKEAFDAAGMKIESPVVSMPNQRRTNLPVGQAAVFDLKPGDVSQVINDAGGHYIYKLKSKDQLPLDQVKDEIRRALQQQRVRDTMEKVNNSFQVERNEAYFGPAGPPPGMPFRGPQSGNVPGNAPAGQVPPPPQQAAPPSAAPPSQLQAPPPAQAPQPPAAKPN